jgi:hypothetical protein
MPPKPNGDTSSVVPFRPSAGDAAVGNIIDLLKEAVP